MDEYLGVEVGSLYGFVIYCRFISTSLGGVFPLVKGFDASFKPIAVSFSLLISSKKPSASYADKFPSSPLTYQTWSIVCSNNFFIEERWHMNIGVTVAFKVFSFRILVLFKEILSVSEISKIHMAYQKSKYVILDLERERGPLLDRIFHVKHTVA